ncbi:MAG: 8-oxoguanine DNA glycosylase, N-terminal domain-containing protein, partial [Verrucomicrobia subdivision 3 bacterium]|nr:8-oxoguanine DNA glycosylase, N-terminal domain-containing protein [Limisphaerales bacterium]
MSGSETLIPVRDYDLAATLSSGQTFRWERCGDAWEGVVGGRWVRLQQLDAGIYVQTAERITHWEWLTYYLQADIDLDAVLQTFPKDEPMRASVASCRGLRLLRQDP